MAWRMDKARRSMSSVKLRKPLPNDRVLGVWRFDSMVPAGNRQLSVLHNSEFCPLFGIHGKIAANCLGFENYQGAIRLGRT